MGTRKGRRHGNCQSCGQRNYLWTYGGRHLCRGCYNRAVQVARGLRAAIIR